MTWIIENEAFADGDILLPALEELKKNVILWDDKFWNTEEYKSFPEDWIFHGSFGNVAKLEQKFPFYSGLNYREEFFSYSFTHNNFTKFMLNKEVIFTTISEVLSNPSITKQLKTEKIFIRPDSPLKEFSMVLEKPSVFVDENFVSFNEQWKYLSSVFFSMQSKIDDIIIFYGF